MTVCKKTRKKQRRRRDMLQPSHNKVSYLFVCISMLKKETLDPSHNTVSYLFICISILKKEGNPYPSHNTVS
jgi:hypothetical protein